MGGRNVIVRFDKEYSYGDEHDAWKEFAKTVGESSADMLVGDVGVSEYGDKDNSDLSERFKIGADDFPQFRLWTKGKDSTKEPVKFSGAKKSEEFMKFIQSNAACGLACPVRSRSSIRSRRSSAAPRTRRRSSPRRAR